MGGSKGTIPITPPPLTVSWSLSVLSVNGFQKLKSLPLMKGFLCAKSCGTSLSTSLLQSNNNHPILPMRRLRFREIKQLAQGHTAPHVGLSDSEPVLFLRHCAPVSWASADELKGGLCFFQAKSWLWVGGPTVKARMDTSFPFLPSHFKPRPGLLHTSIRCQ